MAARRVATDDLQELVPLHRMGTGAREVARLPDISPNTERRYREALSSLGLLAGHPSALPSPGELKRAIATLLPPSEPPPQQRSGIEAHHVAVQKLFDEGLGAKEIRRRLRENNSDFPGSYAQVKRMVQGMKQVRGVRAEDVAIPARSMILFFGVVGRATARGSPTARFTTTNAAPRSWRAHPARPTVSMARGRQRPERRPRGER